VSERSERRSAGPNKILGVPRGPCSPRAAACPISVIVDAWCRYNRLAMPKQPPTMPSCPQAIASTRPGEKIVPPSPDEPTLVDVPFPEEPTLEDENLAERVKEAERQKTQK
jgi:hypothetical protein